MHIYKFTTSDFVGDYDWEFAAEYFYDNLGLSEIRQLVREPGWIRLVMKDDSTFAIPTDVIAYVKMTKKEVISH